jgi:hypothetical protein
VSIAASRCSVSGLERAVSGLEESGGDGLFCEG